MGTGGRPGCGQAASQGSRPASSGTNVQPSFPANNDKIDNTGDRAREPPSTPTPTAKYSQQRPPTSPLTPTISVASLSSSRFPCLAPAPAPSINTDRLTGPGSGAEHRPAAPGSGVVVPPARPTAVPLTFSALPVSSPPSQLAGPGRAGQDGQDRRADTDGQTEWMTDPPEPVPVAENDNTDVIAVRAVMSILQIQREKAERDIRTLVKLREMAVDDPTGFSQALQQRAASLMNKKNTAGSGPARAKRRPQSTSDFLHSTFNSWDSPDEPSGSRMMGRFPEVPEAQNIANCPPVNWSKYAIVGSSLDKMHAEQVVRPTQGEPMMLVPVAAAVAVPTPSSGSTVRKGASGSSAMVGTPASAPAGSTYVLASTVDPAAVNPALRQELDYYGRAPEHAIASPHNPFDSHERARVGVRQGEWQAPAGTSFHPAVGPGSQLAGGPFSGRESRRASRRSVQQQQRM